MRKLKGTLLLGAALVLSSSLWAPAFGEASSLGGGGAMGTVALCVAMGVIYGGSWKQSQALREAESKLAEVTTSGKGPRIGALDSLRFVLIAYIASGHFIHTATKNPFLLRMITQINVVVGAFFVISGYVAAYTTTTLGQRKGTERLDNAFLYVDVAYSGWPTALWHGFISTFMLQAWFPTSAEVWNAPTWFLSALTFAFLALPYCLRVLATQKKEQLRRTLVILTLVSLVPKIAYSSDLHSWGIMEGMLNAKTHPNYAVFNSLRFSPLGALLEVLMGAAACRLVMLDHPQAPVPSGPSMAPLLAMVAVLGLRATGAVQLNDMLTRSGIFIPLWIMFLMRIHRESVSKEGAMLPQLLCKKPLVFLGGISFPIFVVHGPVGQLFYKKAVATAVWGQNMASPQAVGIHWFFLVYWLTVLVCAQILQKCFLESPHVKKASKTLEKGIVRMLS